MLSRTCSHSVSPMTMDPPFDDIDIPLHQRPLSKAIDESLFNSLLASSLITLSKALVLSASIPHCDDGLLSVPFSSLGLHLADWKFLVGLQYCMALHPHYWGWFDLPGLWEEYRLICCPLSSMWWNGDCLYARISSGALFLLQLILPPFIQSLRLCFLFLVDALDRLMFIFLARNQVCPLSWILRLPSLSNISPSRKLPQRKVMLYV